MTNRPFSFEKFHVWQVVVPARQEILMAPADPGMVHKQSGKWPEMPIHLVEGVTTQGIVAVGECGRGTSRAVVEETLRELLGRDLSSITPATIWQGEANASGLPRSYPYWSWELANNKSYVLFESLCPWHLAKAMGMAAHQMLGGSARSRVPVDFWIYRPDAPTMAKLIQEAVTLGLRGVKMKSSAHGDTVQSLLAIAADVPEGFHITIDPMCAWRSLRECARQLDKLSQLPFDFQIEDPFPYMAIEDWRAARQISPLTIACHARTEDVLQLAVREEMADTYNLGRGSVYDFLRLSHVTEFMNKDCWQGSSLELGVLQQLRLHASACARNCVLPSDLQSEWVREHTIVTPRMMYEDGHAVVLDRPGLGVELDHQAIEQYTVAQFDVIS